MHQCHKRYLEWQKPSLDKSFELRLFSSRDRVYDLHHSQPPWGDQDELPSHFELSYCPYLYTVYGVCVCVCVYIEVICISSFICWHGCFCLHSIHISPVYPVSEDCHNPLYLDWGSLSHLGNDNSDVQVSLLWCGVAFLFIKKWVDVN